MENIGKRIKELRKKNDLTQEKLADYLNVSFQAVSKWEKGDNAPDLGLLVPLSRILHVSLDELMGNDAQSADERRAQLEADWQKARFGQSDPTVTRAAAAALVREYPGEARYLSQLAGAEALCCEAVRQGRLAGRADDLLERALGHALLALEVCDSENLALWERILAQAAQFLCALGRPEEALVYARQIKYDQDARDSLLSKCLPPEERTKYVQELCYRHLNSLLEDLRTLGMQYSGLPETVIDLLNRLIPDGNYLHFHDVLGAAWEQYARSLVRNGQPQQAVDALRQAWGIQIHRFSLCQGRQYRRLPKPQQLA